MRSRTKYFIFSSFTCTFIDAKSLEFFFSLFLQKLFDRTYNIRCGHCKRLKPEYAKAGELLRGSDPQIVLAKVDCTEGGKDTCSKFSISGYPTLKIFKNGEFSQDYNGPREAGL